MKTRNFTVFALRSCIFFNLSAKVFSLILCGLLGFCYCTNVFPGKSEKVSGIKVTQVSPNMTPNGRVNGYDTSSINIYYHENYRLYKLVYHFDSIVDDVTIISEDRYHYILHTMGSNSGFDYDLKKSPTIRKVNMDSVFRVEGIFQTDLCPVFFKFSATLTQSQKSDNSNTLKEVYNLKGIEDSSMTGTCFVEFTTKMKNIDFTFCKELDSIKKMKLQKIKIVNDPRYYNAGGFYIDKAVVEYSVEVERDINFSEINPIFETLKRSRALSRREMEKPTLF